MDPEREKAPTRAYHNGDVHYDDGSGSDLLAERRELEGGAKISHLPRFLRDLAPKWGPHIPANFILQILHLVFVEELSASYSLSYLAVLLGRRPVERIGEGRDEEESCGCGALLCRLVV